MVTKGSGVGKLFFKTNKSCIMLHQPKTFEPHILPCPNATIWHAKTACAIQLYFALIQHCCMGIVISTSPISVGGGILVVGMTGGLIPVEQGMRPSTPLAYRAIGSCTTSRIFVRIRLISRAGAPGGRGRPRRTSSVR